MTPIDLLPTYRQKGVLVDTNILLLYVIGSLDEKLLLRHKRTQQFTIEDYRLLNDLLAAFDRVVTSPGVLTEVSNLSGQIDAKTRTLCLRHLAEVIQPLHEVHLESRSVADAEHFSNLGLSDSAIIEIARGSYLVLTDDFTLAQFLAHNNVDVINFNHLRILGWE
jgi:rRNA-processing protein FCF1